MEAIGLLAGGLAHDVNNLLTVINGCSAMALDGLEPENHLRGDLEQIRRAGQRAAELTGQLLAFSRQQVLNLVVLDLNEVVSGVEQMLRRLISENIIMTTQLSPEPCCIKADQTPPEPIIVNPA